MADGAEDWAMPPQTPDASTLGASQARLTSSTHAGDDVKTIKEKVTEQREVFSNSKLARFIPAMLTCMVWLYIVSWHHDSTHTLYDEIFTDRTGDEFWPMTLAMILGSLIAGSTPLGGGVVAFPVAVIVINFTAPQGRDFAVLIQSVGMNAAGYLLVLRAGQPVHTRPCTS